MLHRRAMMGLSAAAACAMALPAFAAQSAYDFAFASIDGGPLALEAYRGQALLVVNTASFCGFTHQYEGLQALWTRHRQAGLVVIGVPSNQFGNQEPGQEAEIKAFCETHFGIDFPMASKTLVKGPDAHPFYRWAAVELGDKARPKWNFHKILIGSDGRALEAFPSRIAPDAAELERAIEAALP